MFMRKGLLINLSVVINIIKSLKKFGTISRYFLVYLQLNVSQQYSRLFLLYNYWFFCTVHNSCYYNINQRRRLFFKNTTTLNYVTRLRIFSLNFTIILVSHKCYLKLSFFQLNFFSLFRPLHLLCFQVIFRWIEVILLWIAAEITAVIAGKDTANVMFH